MSAPDPSTSPICDRHGIAIEPGSACAECIAESPRELAPSIRWLARSEPRDIVVEFIRKPENLILWKMFDARKKFIVSDGRRKTVALIQSFGSSPIQESELTLRLEDLLPEESFDASGGIEAEIGGKWFAARVLPPPAPAVRAPCSIAGPQSATPETIEPIPGFTLQPLPSDLTVTVQTHQPCPEAAGR